MAIEVLSSRFAEIDWQECSVCLILPNAYPDFVVGGHGAARGLS